MKFLVLLDEREVTALFEQGNLNTKTPQIRGVTEEPPILLPVDPD